MDKGYFATSWSDITRSPGWFPTLVRLGLVSLIPVFGMIVVYGYLYNWAREIAWNVHRPLPWRVFGNEDGMLYKRGFFILLIGFVFSLVPGVVYLAGSMISGGMSLMSMAFSPYDPGYSSVGSLFLASLCSFVSLILGFAVSFFVWVGGMRTAIYGTLSAGFQVGKIWTMMRRDFMGLLRIFAISLICGFVVGTVFTIVGTICIALIFAAFAVAVAGNSSLVPGLFFVLFVLALFVVGWFAAIFVSALVIRSLGYWTRQFDVAQWGGQEDPLPFEVQTHQQPPYAATAYQQQPPVQSAPFQSGATSATQTGWVAPDQVPVQAAPFNASQGTPVYVAPFTPEQSVPIEHAAHEDVALNRSSDTAEDSLASDGMSHDVAGQGSQDSTGQGTNDIRRPGGGVSA